ncbi:ASCH domain-containing protein [Plebeiibacterium sediminum]|uniref:ASCH domain-containing protein n=1 Tax=Plebeiibacterium sediminum TaxID=2992112 RepID=A0AAE3MAB2_9BACT|nr:ASCH domain-containing protein [Plebeiobacterium sediminum]MCW3789370.1 ASCH domain-containing protein [Plebeiobacterium sediminum]
MKIILSIKPEFVERIFNGTKKFEFRRLIFKNSSVNKVVIYASAPISKVVGEFEIKSVHKKKLNELWAETSEFSGISKDYFFNYFKGKTEGYALEIKKVTRYNKQLCIKEEFGIVPPQSFTYLREEKLHTKQELIEQSTF